MNQLNINIQIEKSSLYFRKFNNYILLYVFYGQSNKYLNECFELKVFYYGKEDLLFYKCMMNDNKLFYIFRIKVIYLTGVSANKTLCIRNDINRELFNYRSQSVSKKVLLEK